MAECATCIHHDICVKLGKPSLYGINEELGCDKHLEAVYCKDCKYLHCHSAVDRMFFCNNPKGLKGMPNIVEENPFCPYGKRREANGVR